MQTLLPSAFFFLPFNALLFNDLQTCCLVGCVELFANSFDFVSYCLGVAFSPLLSTSCVHTLFDFLQESATWLCGGLRLVLAGLCVFCLAAHVADESFVYFLHLLHSLRALHLHTR